MTRAQTITGGLMGASGSASTPRAVKNVAWRGEIGDSTITNSGSKTQYKLRRGTTIQVACSSIGVLLTAFNMIQGGTGTSPTSDVNYAAVALECNGVTVPVTASGSQSITVPSGTILQSDMIPASAFGLASFPAGTVVYHRAVGNLVNTGTAPARGADWGAMSGELYCLYDPANAINDVYSTGAMTAPTGAILQATGPFPNMLLGVPLAPCISLIDVVDSIGDGVGDIGNATLGALTGAGWMRRAADLGNYPYCQLGKTGLKASQWDATQASILKYCTHVVVQRIINDAVTSAQPLATCQAALQTIWAAAAAAGCSVVQGLCSVEVIQNNHTNWTTTADQSLSSPSQVGGVADQVNTWLATQVGGAIVATIDTRTPWFDANNKWLLRSFNTTLSSSTLAGASVLPLNASPPIGELLVTDPGNTDVNGTPIPGVRSVTGSGPFTVQMWTTYANPYASSTVVKSSFTLDGTHPSGEAHYQCALNSALPVYAALTPA